MLTCLVTFNLGCTIKAHLFGIKIIEVLKEELYRYDLAPPYKQFVFGILTFNTDNALPNRHGVRQVAWFGHVAPVVRLAENPSQFYILDAAISGKPILRDVWYQMLVQNRESSTQPEKWGRPAVINGKVICKPDTIDWNMDCFNPNLATDYDDYDDELEDITQSFLMRYELFMKFIVFKIHMIPLKSTNNSY